MRRAMGLCFRGALVLAVLFGGLGLLFPQGVMSIFLPKGESFGYAIQYLTIVAAGFLITAVDTVYATCVKSAGHLLHPDQYVPELDTDLWQPGGACPGRARGGHCHGDCRGGVPGHQCGLLLWDEAALRLPLAGLEAA